MGPSEAPGKAELPLLPMKRVDRNEAHQWLTAQGCAHSALLHCEQNKNHCKDKVCQRSSQGGLALTFLLALTYQLKYMWHMQSSGSCWRGIQISTVDWHDWEYNEKKDVQKLNKHVKSKSEVGKESVKKIKAGGGAKMAEDYEGESTFSPTNSSKEHLNDE